MACVPGGRPARRRADETRTPRSSRGRSPARRKQESVVVMLSDLTGRTVLDDAGRRGKLVDLAVDLSDDEHPAVTLLIVRQGNANRLVPAEQVTSWERPIRVTDIEVANPCPDDLLAE